jgi:hypothetical protein
LRVIVGVMVCVASADALTDAAADCDADTPCVVDAVAVVDCVAPALGDTPKELDAVAVVLGVADGMAEAETVGADDAVPLELPVAEADGVAVCDGVDAAVTEGVAAGVPVTGGVPLAVGVKDDDTVLAAVPDADTPRVGDAVSDAVTVAVPVSEPVRVGVTDGDGATDTDGDALFDGEADADALADAVGVAVHWKTVEKHWMRKMMIWYAVLLLMRKKRNGLRALAGDSAMEYGTEKPPLVRCPSSAPCTPAAVDAKMLTAVASWVPVPAGYIVQNAGVAFAGSVSSRRHVA